MAGHLMPFAAFLVEPQPRAPALLKIILDLERDDRTDAGEGVAHQPEQGAYASRVLRLRIVAVKNSMKRRLARSPWARMIVGNVSRPARPAPAAVRFGRLK